jgi:hypothetical protein
VCVAAFRRKREVLCVFSFPNQIMCTILVLVFIYLVLFPSLNTKGRHSSRGHYSSCFVLRHIHRYFVLFCYFLLFLSFNPSRGSLSCSSRGANLGCIPACGSYSLLYEAFLQLHVFQFSYHDQCRCARTPASKKAAVMFQSSYSFYLFYSIQHHQTNT